MREHRRPAFLHLRTVRLMGHAGSDVESSYRGSADIEADLDRDPLLGTARLLVDAELLTPTQVLERYEETRTRVLAVASEVSGAPQLGSAAAVMAPLAPASPDAVAAAAARLAAPDRRAAVFGRTLPEQEGPLTLAQALNRALLDVLAVHPRSARSRPAFPATAFRAHRGIPRRRLQRGWGGR